MKHKQSIDFIEDILNKKFKENTTNRSFSLLEDAPDAKCKIARFEYSVGKCIAYKFDKRSQNGGIIDIFPFFSNETNVKKMCDFILFYEREEDNLFVILCNLKSDLSGSNEKQLKAAEIFADFIMKTAARIAAIEIPYKLEEVHFRSKCVPQQSGTNARKKKIIIGNEVPIQKEAIIHNYFVSNDVKQQTCKLQNLCK